MKNSFQLSLGGSFCVAHVFMVLKLSYFVKKTFFFSWFEKSETEQSLKSTEKESLSILFVAFAGDFIALST